MCYSLRAVRAQRGLPGSCPVCRRSDPSLGLLLRENPEPFFVFFFGIRGAPGRVYSIHPATIAHVLKLSTWCCPRAPAPNTNAIIALLQGFVRFLLSISQQDNYIAKQMGSRVNVYNLSLLRLLEVCTAPLSPPRHR